MRITPTERFTVDYDEIGIESVRDLVAVDSTGVWYSDYGSVESRFGFRLVHRDVASGEDDVEIELDAWIDAERSVMVGDVLWVPGLYGPVTDTDRPRVIVRVDLASHEFEMFPAPGVYGFLDTDGVAVWAEARGTDSVTVHRWNDDGPVGEPITLTETPEFGALSAILLPTEGGVFDCLAGSWGFTGAGGAARVELGESGTGCNAVPVETGWIVVMSGGLRLLSPEGLVSEIAVPEAVVADRLVIGGPAQRGAHVFLVAGQFGEVAYGLDVDLATMSSTMVEIVSDLGEFEPGYDQWVDAVSGAGRLGYIGLDHTSTGYPGGIVGDLDATGAPVWSHVDARDVGDGALSLRMYGDRLFVEQHVGEPGEPLYTWHEVVTSG